MKPNVTPEPLPPLWRRRPVLIVAAVVLLGTLALLVVRPKSQDAATSFHEVRRGDFTVTVLDRGTLSAVSEVSIRSEVEGTARIIYIVPEGTYVKKNDLLVELDSSQAQDQVNLQKINFEKAQFGVVQAEAQLKIQESAVESDIRAAELKVEFALMDLNKFDEGEEMVNLIEASNKVVEVESNLAVAKDTFDWTTRLNAKGYETKQRLDTDRLNVLRYQNSVVSSSNILSMLVKFDIKKQRKKLQSDYEEAKKELERVKAQSARKLEQSKADLTTQANTLELNRKKLERDMKNLEACKIRAKQDGLVVYAMSENRFSSESLIEEGAVVRNRQELIKLPDTSRMKVTIKVHESHVGLVQPGQPAFVKLDSMPDQRFEGVVEKVALLPDSQSRFGNPNLKVYNTEVVVTDPLPGVKPGVSAQAEIVITNISDTLSVPLQAVTTLRGRQVVYIAQGSRNVPVPVQVGMFNTKFIEIVSGIKQGEKVLLSPPFDTQEKDLENAILSADEKAKAATNGTRRVVSARGAATNLAKALRPPAVRPGSSPEGEEAGDAPAERRREAGPGETPRNPGRPEALAQYDKDGDGQLNATEREAMRLAMASRLSQPEGAASSDAPGGAPRFNPEEMMKQFDKNGDGELDEQEREAMRAAMAARGGRGGGPRLSREEMLKRFDKNGDGELDESERAAMRESQGGRGGRSERPQGGGAGRQPGPGNAGGETTPNPTQ